jgi:acyl dehydratase
MSGLYLEDFFVGQRFSAGGFRIDADDIKRFAAEFDPQPFHLDEEAAAESFFGGLAASGWHTAAITMRLMVEGALPIAGGIIGAGGEELKWLRPVRPGDVLSVQTEVIEVSPAPPGKKLGRLKVRVTTVNQRNEAVQVSVGNILAPMRSRILSPSRGEPGEDQSTDGTPGEPGSGPGGAQNARHRRQ